MSPLEVLKQAVKDKSWPMVRLALGEFEKTGEIPREMKTPTVNREVPTHKKPNLFHDDGTEAKVITTQVQKDGSYVELGENNLGGFEEDKKFNSGKSAPRMRNKHQVKNLKCSVCHKTLEVDNQTYAYYTKAHPGGDRVEYTCPSCM
jgi:hypothetical protein